MRVAPLPGLLAKSPLASTQIVLYRATSYKAMRAYNDPLYAGQGRDVGFRYTPQGGPLSYYAAVEIETALRETLRKYYPVLDAWTTRTLPSPLPVVEAITVFSVFATLRRVLDLTSPGVLKVLNLTTQELLEEWLPVQERGEPVFTQELGKAAFDAGFSALRYPSSRHAGNACYVIFPDNFAQGESLTLAGEWETEWHQKGVSSLS